MKKKNTNQTFTLDSFTIEQVIKISEFNKKLIEVHLSAFDENQEKVDDVQKLVFDKDE